MTSRDKLLKLVRSLNVEVVKMLTPPARLSHREAIQKFLLKLLPTFKDRIEEYLDDTELATGVVSTVHEYTFERYCRAAKTVAKQYSLRQENFEYQFAAVIPAGSSHTIHVSEHKRQKFEVIEILSQFHAGNCQQSRTLHVTLPALGDTPGDQVVDTFKAKYKYCLQTSQVLGILNRMWADYSNFGPYFVAYDDACDLLHHIVAQNANDSWITTTKFVVDVWHYIGHRASDILCGLWCNPAPVNGSQPDLILVEEDGNGVVHQTRAFNTETAEQLNSWLNGFEAQLRQTRKKDLGLWTISSTMWASQWAPEALAQFNTNFRRVMYSSAHGASCERRPVETRRERVLLFQRKVAEDRQDSCNLERWAEYWMPSRSEDQREPPTCQSMATSSSCACDVVYSFVRVPANVASSSRQLGQQRRCWGPPSARRPPSSPLKEFLSFSFCFWLSRRKAGARVVGQMCLTSMIDGESRGSENGIASGVADAESCSVIPQRNITRHSQDNASTSRAREAGVRLEVCGIRPLSTGDGQSDVADVRDVCYFHGVRLRCRSQCGKEEYEDAQVAVALVVAWLQRKGGTWPPADLALRFWRGGKRVILRAKLGWLSALDDTTWGKNCLATLRLVAKIPVVARYPLVARRSRW
ncbi:hypothetical protein C8R47DRAFT_1083461 [Mycena vitilis]|nr:hypothetical protein C8R47DRAFT_1083461 [Mycena vitilis]